MSTRMPAQIKGHRNLILGLGLFCLILLSLRVYATNTMETLPSPFTIEINDQPIAGPQPDEQDRTPAKLGQPPAIFQLKDRRLHCGGHILSRHLAEDRSLAPKSVFWFKADTDMPIHDVVANEKDNSYKLEIAGASLTTEDGRVLADVMGQFPAKVVIKMMA